MYMDTFDKIVCTAIILFVLVFCGWIGADIKFKYENPHYEIITVKEKTVGISKDKSSYLVYTENEVYEIRDLLFVGFFTSSDVFNSLEVGKTYKVYTRGRRFPLFSNYKNILEVKEE